MSTSPNIKNIRQLYNLTQEEFALALGITRELVNKMEKGKTGVSKATRLLIQNFLQERQSENYSQEMTFLGVPSHNFEKHSNPQPYLLDRREQKKQSTSLQVPLIGIKAQAGYIKGYEHVDYIGSLEKYSLPPGVNPSGAIWSYFEVDGDSMEPTLYAGDILLTTMLPREDWNDIKNHSVYIILTNDQLLVKRVRQKSPTEWTLISDNAEAYPPIEINLSSIRQVWTFRRHIRSRLPMVV
ncbi:MAG: S24 family peptidase [Flavisolibacter sp.]